MKKTQVFKEFEAISAVPRASFHNEKAIKYVIDQAIKLGLEYIYDEKNGNIVIRKPASKGREKRTPIVLQGHLDMVAKTKPGVKHDFEKEPLKLKIKGDYCYAEGTTLGGDNGVAVALAMAILKDKDVKTPPLEVLFTTDEEVGMRSVRNADLKFLKAKYLINLDHCEEGKLITGCCGGTLVKFRLPKKQDKFSGVKYTIKIDGLTGGHSGIEIDKERANAIKLMAHLLLSLKDETDLRIKSFNAPGKDNAIQERAEAEIIAPSKDEEAIKKAVMLAQKNFRHIFRNSDPGIKISVEKGSRYTGLAFTKAATDKLISLLVQLPFGVIKREQSDHSKVETSANVGVAETGKDTVDITYSIRSSVEKRGEMIAARVADLGRLVGAKTEVTKEYPAWLKDDDSPLVEPCRQVYKKLFGSYPEVDTVHAGLECGYILKNSNIKTAIAFGASVIGEHTTEEKLSISSLNRTYDYLKAVLEKI